MPCREEKTRKIEARAGQRGFVLVATLWVLAIVTIGAAFFAERVATSLALARQKQETAEELVAFANTRAEILYRLGTLRFTRSTLGTAPGIVIDDRAYRGSGGDIVRLQDNRGLLNVNFVDPAAVARFLGLMGIPIEKRDSMVDTLLDYTDPDDLRRLNGAEARDYAAAGLPPPPNDWMVSPHQLKGVIGWRDQHDLWEKKNALQFFTTARVAGFNPNSAPLEVLASLPGMTRESAASLIKRREAAPLYNHLQLAEFGAVDIDTESVLFFPGNSFRVTQQSPRLPWAVQFGVTLTPLGDEFPWRIDYFTRTVVSYALENEAEIPKLPTRSAGAPQDQALYAFPDRRLAAR